MKKVKFNIFASLMISTFLMSGTQSFINVNAEETTRAAGQTATADLTIGFSIDDSLEVVLGSNNISFGTVTPTGGDVQSTTLQVTSSLDYKVSTMAYDDFVGATDPLNIIPVETVSLGFDAAGYNPLSKVKFTNIDTAVAGIDKVYNMNFKIGNTLGYKKDNYSASVQIIVDAL